MLVATSMRQAQLLKTATVRVLDLSRSPDVICMNMMCDKLEGPCVCRVARFLEQNQWDALEEIRLVGNRLDQVPPSIFMRGLKRLDLSDNSIKELPLDISRCESLETLDMSKNRLVKVAWNALLNLPNLKTIDFRENKSLTIPDNVDLSGKNVLL